MSHKNRKAPELTTPGALRNKSYLSTVTPPLYHNTRPRTYPIQRIYRSRSGWLLRRWDGYGGELRVWRRYRHAITELLDRFGGVLTAAAADVVIGGRR